MYNTKLSVARPKYITKMVHSAIRGALSGADGRPDPIAGHRARHRGCGGWPLVGLWGGRPRASEGAAERTQMPGGKLASHTADPEPRAIRSADRLWLSSGRRSH